MAAQIHTPVIPGGPIDPVGPFGPGTPTLPGGSAGPITNAGPIIIVPIPLLKTATITQSVAGEPGALFENYFDQTAGNINSKTDTQIVFMKAASGPFNFPQTRVTLTGDFSSASVNDWKITAVSVSVPNFEINGPLYKTVLQLTGISVTYAEIQAAADNGFAVIANKYKVDYNGSAGNDTFTGGIHNDYIKGNGGNDTLNGGAGVDKLDGGAGNDTFVLGADSDTVVDASGVDRITSSVTRSLAGYATIENLVLTGNQAISGTGNGLNNSIVGNAAKNTLSGGVGNDTLNGGAGLDKLDGGVGNDTYVLGAEADTVTDASGVDRITSTITRSLASYASIENLTLVGTAAVNGTGNGLANTLTGNDAANKLSGGNGNDVLKGGLGNDTLDGGVGADKLDGGGGNDTYVLGSTTDTITDVSGIDRITTTVTRSLGGYATVENLVLSGTTAISGTGNGLANTIVGNGAANTLSGAAGADRLQGGLGKDRLVGGADKDVFDFDTAAWASKGSTRDVITDFQHAVDRVDLSTIDADPDTAGNQVFKFLAAKGAAFTGVDGQLHWFQENNSGVANDRTIIEGDLDGNKVADFQIELTGLVTLTSGDFIL